MQIINDDNFDTEVMESNVPVLLYFSATWCGPCRTQLPILEKWSADNSQIKVVKIDVDQSPRTTKEHDIKSIPTLILVKEGKELSTKKGLTKPEQLNEMLELLA